MYRISKRFSFSASHRLLSLPPEHKCNRLHGHNYLIEVVLESETLDLHGFVVDYGELAPFKRHLDEVYDHRHLNDLMDTEPTAENLAERLYAYCKALWSQTIAVRVSETENTWAEFHE